MTVEELTEEKRKEKNSVLVGIRIDSPSRLLLNWALVKVARPGDRVIAVHVCRDPEDHALKEKNDSLKCYLEVYEGLCNVKQVDLIGQVLHGNSVKRVLVREAKNCAAMAVVVGINKQKSLRSWASVAKYCAKRIPRATAVLAIHNGRNVVFERASPIRLPAIEENQIFVSSPIRSSTLKEDQSGFGDLKVPVLENPSSQVVQNSKDAYKDGTGDSEADSFSVHESQEDDSLDSISLLMRDLPESRDASKDGSGDSEADGFSVHEYQEEDSLDSISLLMRDLPESRPGWPLLRRAVSEIPQTLTESEARKMSVVQWVMSLPNRSPPLGPKTQKQFGSATTENAFRKALSDNVNMSTNSHLFSWVKLPKEVELLLKTNFSGCKWYSHKELKNSTSHFAAENLIGKGGCSRVYKGCLPDGKPVATKILKSSKEGWKEFLLEFNIICSLKHKNITPLIGVCIGDNDLISVYDFLPKGSLEDNLHDKKGKNVLPWEVRFDVAVGVAEALNYLHNDCSPPVIHRDIKSSNILLNHHFKPQLSDFGLAIWGPTNSAFVTHCDVVGTFGYLAPEYFMYGKVSDKIDVYSFGVVLLELLSGRKPIGSKTPKGQESLVMWAKPILESGDLRGILDPELHENFDEIQMQRMVLAATLCITQRARLRPGISKVLRLLRGENDLVNDPKEPENQDDDEVYPDCSVASHLGLALLDVAEDTTSFSSSNRSNRMTLEDYLKGRWSRSSSFD